jgi:hypothetical protein
MIRLIEFLIAIALVLAIFLVVGVLLPSHRYVRNTTETSRPLPVVYDFLSGFRRFKDWTPLHAEDPKIQLNVSGPENGVGAQLDYTSNNPLIGSGTWHVTDAVPGQKIIMSVTNKDYGNDKVMSFRFKKVGNQKLSVEISQEYEVDYGWNLFGRYAGLYVTRSIGDPMKRGLTNISTQLAAIPKFDYTTLAVLPKIVKTPAENLLVAPTTAKRANEEVQSAMETQEKWLHQVMDKNGLEAAGSLRVITKEFGADNYSFDLAIPVRKTGTTTPADAPPPKLDVKIEGDKNPVKYVQTAAGSAVTTTYSGHMAQLAPNREMIKAWALVHGVPTADRPYETYNKGIATSFTSDGDFTMFWPLKPADAK